MGSKTGIIAWRSQDLPFWDEISQELVRFTKMVRNMSSLALTCFLITLIKMIKGTSGGPKRRQQSRHNPLAADIDADEKRGVRLKKPLKDTRGDDDSGDEREVRHGYQLDSGITTSALRRSEKSESF